MDKRRKYVIVLDTETCNTRMDENGKLDCADALVYDLGFVVCDKRGHVYESRSYVISDIFFGERVAMQSAYYADKLPNYFNELISGQRKMVTFRDARFDLVHLIEKYNIKEVYAHNASFDCKALNATERYLTGSCYRYFIPFGVKWCDTLKMARQTIGKQKTYKRFCETHGYMTSNHRVRLTAEILYRYIHNNTGFEEAHTGLEDVIIEKEIMARCFRQHKKMNRFLYTKTA